MIEIERLNVRFGEFQAVRDVSFRVTAGEAFDTGTEAYVARVTLADGTAAVLKVLLPWPGGPPDHEPAVLGLARGHGIVRLLRHDPARRAVLLEHLGASLDRLASQLLERETLTRDELYELLGTIEPESRASETVGTVRALEN